MMAQNSKKMRTNYDHSISDWRAAVGFEDLTEEMMKKMFDFITFGTTVSETWEAIENDESLSVREKMFYAHICTDILKKQAKGDE